MADDGWQDLIAVEQIEKGWVTRVDLGSRPLAVYDTRTGLHVSLALCNHGGADLCDGYFDGHVIECPLHQGAFDVRDGRAVSAPATRAMRTFPVRVKAGWVQVNQGGGQVVGQSYGGYKQSGIGREVSLEGMLAGFTQTKQINVRLKG